MNKSKKVILYAVDTEPRFHKMAFLSIQSLRKHSPQIPIILCVFGKMSEKTGFQWSGNDVDISLSGEISKGNGALCPVCRSALDGGRTVTICDVVLDILVRTNRFSKEVSASSRRA